MNPTRSACSMALAVLFLFAVSCEKTDYTPYVPGSGTDTTHNAGTGSGTPPAGGTASAGSLTFFANGDSATADSILVDTSIFFGNAIIAISGTALIPTTGDSLYFSIQMIGLGAVPFGQFSGTYADTIPTRHTHNAQLLVTDLATDNSFEDQGFTNNYFSTTLSSNDGKSISGTFSGILPTMTNGTPAVMTVTGGKFSVKL